MVMVLFVFLNESKAGVCWDWQALEATGGLKEWQSMVANSQEVPNDGIDVRELPSPLLAPDDALDEAHRDP
jgi:hypothetical protein